MELFFPWSFFSIGLLLIAFAFRRTIGNSFAFLTSAADAFAAEYNSAYVEEDESAISKDK
jgi:hypothetical protein